MTPKKSVETAKASHCYSRRFEEFFTDDNPKEGQDGRTVENEKDKRAPEPKAPGHGQSGDGPASDSVAPDVSESSNPDKDIQVKPE
jgi:hypothetical protein